MPIDFSASTGFEGRALSLAYLVQGRYHDEDGKERFVYWCGPKNRVGSGLVAPLPSELPVAAGKRGASPHMIVWESRLNKCALDADLGPLSQTMQVVNDLSFNVDVSGGTNVPVPKPGDLLRDIVYGRWTNKDVRVWLYDLGSGNTQLIAHGYFDRNPTSINPNVFQVTVGVQPFLPQVEWPSLKLPTEEPENFNGNLYVQNPSGGLPQLTDRRWKAGHFLLNPDLIGKYIGTVHGQGDLAQGNSNPTQERPLGGGTAPGFDWLWREIVPYGYNQGPTSTYTTRHIFCFVSIEPDAYVQEVAFPLVGVYTGLNIENGEPYRPGSNADPWQSGFTTLHNTDPLNGPVGTVVRINISILGSGSPDPDISPNPCIWWMGPKTRIFARIKGSSGSTPWSVQPAVPNVTIMTNDPAGDDRSSPWEIMHDLVGQPHYLRDVLEGVSTGLSGRIWGANALVDFKNATPQTLTIGHPSGQANAQKAWERTCCAIPFDLSDNRPMTLREGLGSLAASYPFDIVTRLDPTVGETRLFPIWRTTFSMKPSRVFTAAELSKTDPPSLTQLDNPDGFYANQVGTTFPEKYGQPHIITGNVDTNYGDNKIDPTDQKTFTVHDPTEQTAEKEGAKIFYGGDVENWHHLGDIGDSIASWSMGIGRSQPQRVVQATHGVRSFDVEMGAPVRYDITGVNSDVGMVRKMRFDYDLQRVQITSYHVEYYTAERAHSAADDAGTDDVDTRE